MSAKSASQLYKDLSFLWRRKLSMLTIQVSFFKYVNKKLGRSHEVGILKTASGENAITDQSKANTLNSFFSSVNVRDNNVIPEFSPRVNENTMLDNIQFRPETIVKLSKKIKPKSSQGPDGYSSYLLTKIVPAIAEPVSMMYQSFMSVGRIPTMWKSAIITPLHKKGVSSDPSNYRPVSLTSVFCKLMERAVVLDLINYLLSNKLMNKQQHGFVKRKCTATNLLESLSDWTLNVENGRRQTVAYIDFAKAFDSVCHSKLLMKLSQYGIKGSLLEWIRDFLTGRSHQTRVNGVLSGVADIVSGVVQGSCLGPVLFLLYINDLTDIFTDAVTVKLYADDVKIYSSIIVNENAIGQELQQNLNKLTKWASDWQLPISYTKCCVLDVGKRAGSPDILCMLDDRTVEQTEEVLDLGVTINNKLNFSKHIAKIVTKAHRRANLIIRCFMSRDTSSLVKAFNV